MSPQRGRRVLMGPIMARAADTLNLCFAARLWAVLSGEGLFICL